MTPNTAVTTSERNEQGAKEKLRKLFLANPMQMETTRFRRRFINVTSSPRLNQTLVGLAALSYLVILGLAFDAREGLVMAGVAYVQQVIAAAAAIVAAHAAIAGEKERRSWDLLQVAPITQHQIVVGKFMGVMAMVTLIQAAFLPLMVLARFSEPHPFNWAYLLVELLCWTSCAFCAAGTIYLSSRMRNANSVLVAGIASAVGIFAAAPAFFAMIFDGRWWNLAISLYHPMYLIYLMATEGQGFLAGLLVSGAYLAAAVGALSVTGRRLTKLRQRE